MNSSYCKLIVSEKFLILAVAIELVLTSTGPRLPFLGGGAGHGDPP